MGNALRIGMVGGGGWLGGAIVDAMLMAGIVAERDLALSYRREKPERFPKAFWTRDSQSLADRSDVIILSVRPQDWPALTLDAAGKPVISVMAGIPLAAICERHGTRRAVRTIPNAAAEVGLSYTPWIGTAETTEADRSIVRAIFDACGVQDEVASEREVDYMTGFAGSGPAFPALLAAAMVDHAVSFGLSRAIAEKAALTVIAGAGRLLERRAQSPDQTVEMFLQYRGTTAAAIEAMRASGFDGAVASGLQKAFEKSLDLAQSLAARSDAGRPGDGNS